MFNKSKHSLILSLLVLFVCAIVLMGCQSSGSATDEAEEILKKEKELDKEAQEAKEFLTSELDKAEQKSKLVMDGESIDDPKEYVALQNQINFLSNSLNADTVDMNDNEHIHEILDGIRNKIDSFSSDEISGPEELTQAKERYNSEAVLYLTVYQNTFHTVETMGNPDALSGDGNPLNTLLDRYADKTSEEVDSQALQEDIDRGMDLYAMWSDELEEYIATEYEYGGHTFSEANSTLMSEIAVDLKFSIDAQNTILNSLQTGAVYNGSTNEELLGKAKKRHESAGAKLEEIEANLDVSYSEDNE